MKDIIWFDIETVAETDKYSTYLKKKYRDDKYLSKPDMQKDTTEQSYYNKSWLYPEFSKVVCISTKIDWKVQSFVWEEKEIIKNFFALLDSKPGYVLGWYNINSFDIPYIRKRSVINGIIPQKLIDVWDTKPREKTSVDVMQKWKQWQFACSLDLLCFILFDSTPKDEWDWWSVFNRYYDWKIDDIKIYCEKDVRYTEEVYKYLINPVWYKEMLEKIAAKKNQDKEWIKEVEDILDPKATETKKDNEWMPF